MPRKDINYSNTIMYKLCCNDPTITDEYVGSTTDKIRRKTQHKSRCHNSNDKYHNLYVYKFIREHGGWNNWSMVVIEEYSCENKNQAELRERYWIETLQSTLNKNIPTRTDKEYYKQYYEQNKEEIRKQRKQYREEHEEEISEYYKQYREEHKEEISEYKKQYREEHKEEIREKANQNFDCECGGKYTHSTKSRHLKTKKHLGYLEQNNI
jgi:hypothetical protein